MIYIFINPSVKMVNQKREYLKILVSDNMKERRIEYSLLSES
jgi:hypothetical protein